MFSVEVPATSQPVLKTYSDSDERDIVTVVANARRRRKWAGGANNLKSKGRRAICRRASARNRIPDSDAAGPRPPTFRRLESGGGGGRRRRARARAQALRLRAAAKPRMAAPIPWHAGAGIRGRISRPPAPAPAPGLP